MSGVLVGRNEAVAVVTLNDPDRRNALSQTLCESLSAAIAMANADETVKAIVITGKGKAFCAGAELSDLKAAAAGRIEPLSVVYSAFIDVLKSPLPTIAAVNGPAVGAGFNLALACDMRLAGEAASFDTRFLRIGLHPGGGHTWMLLRAVGWQTANWVLLAGQALDGREAAHVGLAAKCTADRDLLDETMKVAQRISAAPRELIIKTKASLALAATSPHDVSFRHETAEQQWSLGQSAFCDAINGAR